MLRFPQGRTIDDDVSPYLMAFKDAMSKMVDKYPGDTDIWTLYAESLMNTMPWDYYIREEDENGYLQYKPKPDTFLVYDALEQALTINPNNLLALHLYIHIYEADMKQVISNKNVEIVADRLRDLLQPNIDQIRLCGIGHLVHMPSHIYIRIGRFEDANIANIDAYRIAEEYYDYYNITDIYPNYNQFYRVLYYCHRITFIIYSSMMSGQFQKADDYGQYLYDKCKWSLEHISFFFESSTWRLKNLLRFGKFKELIDKYEKDNEWKEKYVARGDNIYAPIMAHWSRAFAYISSGECNKGWDIYTNQFLPGYESEEIAELMFWLQPAVGILNVARLSFLGRYYDKCENDMEKSVVHWTNAAKAQFNLNYIEPPYWPINIRACLGQVYLDNGEYELAKKAFMDDLEYVKLNGWALKGMIEALNKMGEHEQARLYAKDFEAAWQYADTPIDRACY